MRRSGRTGSARRRYETVCPRATGAAPRDRMRCGCRRPTPFVAGVVDLVEDHEPVRRQSGQLGRGVSRGDLLIGGDQAVDVAGEPVTWAPFGVELQAQPMRSQRPLHLEVAGRRHHDQRTRLVGEAGASAGQRERGLSRSGGGDREVVGVGVRSERFVCSALPGAEGHGRHRRVECGASTGRAQLRQWRHVARTSPNPKPVRRVVAWREIGPDGHRWPRYGGCR